MSASVYVFFASAIGLLLAGVVSRARNTRRLIAARLVVLSAMSGWMLYLLLSGSESGIFPVLLAALLISGAVKSALDLDALRSEMPVDQK